MGCVCSMRGGHQTGPYTVSPLVSSCVHHHYPEALAHTCSFIIYPWGEWRWQWFCQRRKREKEGKWKSSLDPRKLWDPLPLSLQDPGLYAPTSWISEAQVSRVTEVLTVRIKEIQRRFPTWTPDQCLRGACSPWVGCPVWNQQECYVVCCIQFPQTSVTSWKAAQKENVSWLLSTLPQWGAVGSALTNVTNSRWTLCLRGRCWLHPKQPGPELWLLQWCPCTSQVLQETRLLKLQLKPKMPASQPLHKWLMQPASAITQIKVANEANNCESEFAWMSSK